MNNLLTDCFELLRGAASRDRDIELGTLVPTNSGELGLQDSFRWVQEIEKQNEKLSKQLKKFQDANAESRAVTKLAAMEAIKKRMEQDIDEVRKIARLAKSKLEELNREVSGAADHVQSWSKCSAESKEATEKLP